MSQEISEQSLQVVAEANQLASRIGNVEQLRLLFVALLGIVSERPDCTAEAYLQAIKVYANQQGLLSEEAAHGSD